jgi:hypothetical protein
MRIPLALFTSERESTRRQSGHDDLLTQLAGTFAWSAGLVFRGVRKMVGSNFTKLVEKHSEELSRQLAQKLHASSRTKSFHEIPIEDLERDINILYHNLGDWLLYRTEADVQARYRELGGRRARQGISAQELVWAFTIAKEHIISFLRREAVADSALALFSELEFVMSLMQFFDRAIYFALEAQSAALNQKAVA